MQAEKKDIINQLRKDILCLQGFQAASTNTDLDDKLGPIATAFPNGSFPLAAIHEFICAGAQGAAATIGFVAGLLSSLMQQDRVSLWISSACTVFPPALKSFGIAPDHIIFVNLPNEKNVLWAMEEALKCTGLAAVVGEIQEINFTDSRRLQLAVERSKVTGFVLCSHPRKSNTTASVSRWKIVSIPSEFEDDMPGVGFPRWSVELQKVRNGKPGIWDVECIAGRLNPLAKKVITMLPVQKKKTG